MMAGMRMWFSRQSKPLLVVLGVLALLVVGVAFVGVAKATDQPAFCRTCHEMTPYHDAWSQGPHKEVSCIECHVDAGEVARLGHKFVALKEVVAHVRGDKLFPRATPATVPDKRCLTCHAKVTVEQARFDHALHASKGPCAKCHATVGHKVEVSALKDAGIYSGLMQATQSVDASTVAVVDGGKADLAGHKTVVCSRCHLMSKTPCSACHKPKHKPRGTCTTCHAPGKTFVFIHPKNRPDCLTCHQRPAKHSNGSCVNCHAVGPKWVFKHPSASNCSSCHRAPANHFGTNCSSCHTPSRAWKNATFSHPGIPGGEHSYRSFPCVNCHPSGFSSATCAKCHGSVSGPRGG
jgi:nitrate/TMAO reductase-like tetraheme cytochrome c subunit